jgi:hypothetical protein
VAAGLPHTSYSCKDCLYGQAGERGVFRRKASAFRLWGLKHKFLREALGISSIPKVRSSKLPQNRLYKVMTTCRVIFLRSAAWNQGLDPRRSHPGMTQHGIFPARASMLAAAKIDQQRSWPEHTGRQNGTRKEREREQSLSDPPDASPHMFPRQPQGHQKCSILQTKKCQTVENKYCTELCPVPPFTASYCSQVPVDLAEWAGGRACV